MEKLLKKKIKTIQDQGKKQVDILDTLKSKEPETIKETSDDNEKHLKF